MSIYNVNGTELNSADNVNGTRLSQVYNVDGETLLISRDYSNYTISRKFSVELTDSNGFDVYNDVIAQFKSPNKMSLIDMDSGTAIYTDMTVASQHGDSASFSNEFFDDGDEFPLIYVTSDANPALVYVNRVTRTGVSREKTLYFPLEKTGYYAAFAYDCANNIAYMVGYSEQNYSTDNDGSNKTVVSKWDMSTLMQNGDGTYTPTFISSYERDFIYVMQGMQFHDGYIWIASGWYNRDTQHIYAMRPSDGVIDYTINLADTYEVEGLAWVYDEENNKYWMLVGQQTTDLVYSRIDFAEASE